MDESLCVGMGACMNHCVSGMYVYVRVVESLCVGMGAWMNHCVLVWVRG